MKKLKDSRLYQWVKKNLVLSVILALLLFSFLNKLTTRYTGYNTNRYDETAYTAEFAPSGISSLSMPKSNPIPTQSAPVNRVTITESGMSLYVKDVDETINKIKELVSNSGGYIVHTKLSSTDTIDTGHIKIRVPIDKLEDTLSSLKGFAVKVISENIFGNDITDEYTDIQARLSRLYSTKSRLEEIMQTTDDIEQIILIQSNIFSIQDQIDQYKGKLQYFNSASSSVLISVNLSTDELSLPYLPQNAWRPDAVFKRAYRSLLINLVGLGNALIWVVVYIPPMLFALAVFIVIKALVRKYRVRE